MIMYYTLIITQFLAIAVLFGEIIYISLLRPSRFQMEMILLLISTLIMLIGYSVELFATTPESALSGAAVAYIGKPFALLMSLIFVSDYCGRHISKKITIPLSCFSALFPIIVFTNGTTLSHGHHLYYATVNFDINRVFSPLILTRGAFYIVYMIFLISMFASILVVILKSILSKKYRNAKKPLIYIGGMIVCTIAGYLIYLLGITQGYDTTMTGAALGALLLTIVFFKYNLFDMLTYAREHALQNVSTGLLVVNDNNHPVYTNTKIDELNKNGFSLDEMIALPDGKQIVEKLGRVFEIKKAPIEKSDMCYGKTIEIDDITIQHNYNIQLEHDVATRTKEIQDIQRSVLASFAGIVEARDNSTGTHIKRMSRYVELIARSLAKSGKYLDVLTEEYLTSLVDVAPLHDIGKLAIPDVILLKPAKLTNEEFEIMKTHSKEGARIIRECLEAVERPEYVNLAVNVANFHHEKWNGEGYPNHLKGSEIPICARIVAVADVYDAIRSERCYKPAMNKEDALKVILDGKGTHFDPDVVDAFVNVLSSIEAV